MDVPFAVLQRVLKQLKPKHNALQVLKASKWKATEAATLQSCQLAIATRNSLGELELRFLSQLCNQSAVFQKGPNLAGEVAEVAAKMGSFVRKGAFFL